MSEGGQGRARGRASRGRARGAPAGAAPSLQAAAAAGGGGGPAPVQPPPPSAWGRSQPAAQPPKQPLPTTARGKQTQQPQQPQPGYDVRAEAKLAPGVQDVSGAFRGMQISGGAGGPAAPGASSAERPGMQRRGAMRGRSEIAPPLHTKPQSCSSKIGTDGIKINVLSNHFKLVKTTDWSLFQYWVDFSHDEDRTKVRKGLLKNHKDTIGEGYMFDGAMLFTIKKIAMGPDGTKELYSTREYDQEKIRITIKFVNELALGDYMYIQLFNIILRNCIDSLDFQLVGREYFDPHSKEVLPNFKLEIWPGFVTSILQFEHNVMMCVDVSHKVLRKDTVLEFMIECKKRFREDWKEKFEEAILGNTVFTHYNNKPYRVDDVDFDSTPASTFKKGNADVQYVQYYREKYNINVRDMSQPLLISKPKAKDLRGGRDQNVVLIPELCNMTGLSNEMRSNFQLMKAVADKTRIPPNGRIKQYYQFMERMNRTQAVATKLQHWSMKFSPKLEEVPARRFPPEKMIQGNQREFTYGDDGDWTRNIRGGSMLASIPLKKWAIVAPAMLMDKRGQGMIDNFLSELKKAADSLRFEMHPPMKIASEQDKAAGFYTAIEKVMSKGEIELVMCIVPNNRTDIYNSIKKKCCVDRPVPSQVIAVKTLNHKNLLSVATKIVIQMNCKLGGAPWYVPIPFVTAEKKPDPTMIIGFDVCHDSNMKAKSYGALVASLDYYYTKFYSAVSNHAFGEELSNDIATHFTHAVIRYRELNGRLPTRIVMYRDGVGESNIPFVLDHEIEAIKKRYYEVFPGAELKMAVIVVSKRIQTRIFLNNDNPPPGTVVDDVITRPEKFDFFIVSQSVKQGTVTPTSYNVIYDTTGLKAGIIQRITYKMTHMYYNCSCTVRVPAQVQYAHKLAFLVGQAIHQSPSTDLNGQLYFL